MEKAYQDRIKLIHAITKIIEGAGVKLIENTEDAAMLAVDIVDGLEGMADEDEETEEKFVHFTMEGTGVEGRPAYMNMDKARYDRIIGEPTALLRQMFGAKEDA